MFLCGFAPLREIVFESYGGWDGAGFAQRRRGAEVGTIDATWLDERTTKF